jgi:hypothetical protein
MNPDSVLLTEEDVKAKVVNDWLFSHGFGSKDVVLEKTFEIQLGRKSTTIGDGKGWVKQGRCDYLVKAHDGRNLLVVEVKAPGEILDDDVKIQAISYGRLLLTGGMAPFVVVTNGTDVQIFDTITCERIDGAIPVHHPHVLNNFQCTGGDIALRAEALRSFISLSNHNLTAFCSNAVAFHMALLRSDDLDSGKKYIPHLHTKREEETEKLRMLLSDNSSHVTLAVGSPQVGKTNFICRFVEDLLASGEPCLFYPAIGIRQGLISEVLEDFSWTFSESTSIVHIAQKLDLILKKASQRLTIVIDGWNEAESRIAVELNQECKRLGSSNIRFILSTTDTSARRLLVDGANNLGFIADELKLTATAIPLIEEEKRTDVDSLSQFRIVRVGQYSNKEMELSYKTYSSNYNVEVPDEHQKINNPFLIGIAMKHYKGATLPLRLDEPYLIGKYLEHKYKLIGNTDPTEIVSILREVAASAVESDLPVSQIQLLNRLPQFRGILSHTPFFEASILTRRYERGDFTLDFYNGRERDFVVALWIRDWPGSLLSASSRLAEFDFALKTNAGSDALRWFLSQETFSGHLELIAKEVASGTTVAGKQIIISSTTRLLSKGHDSEEWMEVLMKMGLDDPSNLVKIEAVKLLTIMSEEDDDLAAYAAKDLTIITQLLKIDEEFPLEEGSGGHMVLRALRSLQWDAAPEGDASEITSILESIIDGGSGQDRSAAAKALGFIAPDVFFQIITDRLKNNLDQSFAHDIFKGVELACDELEEMLYGSMCPGLLNALEDDPEGKEVEYKKYLGYFNPVINTFGIEKCGRLLGILKALQSPSTPDLPLENKAKALDPNQETFRF